MRIRHYVFDLLAGTGNSVVKLPSNREIARKFGVSQPTVVKALQELVREGYLTIRPGVGAFSNPDRFTHDSKLWGIVLGDGRWSQFSRETLHVINSVGMALLEHDHRNLLKLITMGETMDDERGWPELSMLSGICWWIPTDPLLPSMARIARTIPVVLLGDRKPGFDCFFRDFENENCEIARRMIADGCRRLVLVLPEMEQAAAIRGVEKACREAAANFRPAASCRPTRHRSGTSNGWSTCTAARTALFSTGSRTTSFRSFSAARSWPAAGFTAIRAGSTNNGRSTATPAKSASTR